MQFTTNQIEHIKNRKRRTKRTYLVIGVYESGERFAEDYEATSPEVAERMAARKHSELTIAGVLCLVNGKIEVVA